ncbi:MAG: FimV/HubP family polar landmark protein, partial [Acidiferrobacterales bacterium]
AAPGSSGGINFDLDRASASGTAPALGARPSSEVAAADSGFGQDFDLEGVPATGGDAHEISLDTVAQSAGEQTLDFEPVTGAPRADEGIAFMADASSDAPALEFEGADEGGAEGHSQWDETTTKLDLAKAYIDMGDSEGARSILDEVISEGNENQKNQARELAAQIA